MLRLKEDSDDDTAARAVRTALVVAIERRIEELEEALARLHPQAEESGLGWARVAEAREIRRLVEAL